MEHAAPASLAPAAYHGEDSELELGRETRRDGQPADGFLEQDLHELGAQAGVEAAEDTRLVHGRAARVKVLKEAADPTRHRLGHTPPAKVLVHRVQPLFDQAGMPIERRHQRANLTHDVPEDEGGEELCEDVVAALGVRGGHDARRMADERRERVIEGVEVLPAPRPVAKSRRIKYLHM